MVFKGTKGYWKTVSNDAGHFASVRNIDDTRKICVSRVNNQKENNANMQAISCVPEMMDCLLEIITAFENGALENVDYAKDVLKKATDG